MEKTNEHKYKNQCKAQAGHCPWCTKCEVCNDICSRLKAKGFASTNMVYGIGSYTYQYNTRDTFGYAMKSTLCVIDGQEIQIFKDPVTDSGVKKSAKGTVRVIEEDGVMSYQDQLTLAESNENTLLRDVFVDGKLLVDEKFSDIKTRILNSLKDKEDLR